MSQNVKIEDEDELVDRKTKEQILSLRSQIDDDERMLYVEQMASPESNMSYAEADQYWGISVRQYLRGIKRLWSTEDTAHIRNVEEYWKEMKIGEERLVPPDKDGYQFSLMAHHQRYSDTQLKQLLGLPKRADLPRPKKKIFRGLGSVLNQNKITCQWVVKTSMDGPPPEHETVQLETVKPVPKHILENAVEAADNFLQQAGIGFELAVPDYYGGDEPGI